jgi:hypothetical protein
MACRILSQDEARARRGPIEGPRLRPGSSEQRSSCGRRRSQHDRSNGIVLVQPERFRWEERDGVPDYFARQGESEARAD